MGNRLAKRVLLVGWDGADWQMIRPLLAQGKMPTLKALLDRGVSGNLATIQPVLSPMLWTSIATGKRADKHGIHGFLEPMPDRLGVRPVTSTSRTCKALWNLLTQSGMTSQVVSWFASHPAEPINGSIVTDRFVSQTVAKENLYNCPPGTFHPDSLTNEMSPLIVGVGQIEPDALQQFVPNAHLVDQKTDDRLIRLASLIARTGTVQAAGAHLLHKNKQWDLTALYFIGVDEFGHSFMPYHPPQLEGISEEDAKVYGEVMENCYRFHDMMLGAQLQLAGDDTTVVLVSDHGFKNDELRPGIDATEDPESWHRHHGIVCLSGPGIQPGAKLLGPTVLDITPTILALLGLPVGDDMDGRPWVEVFDQPTQVERIPSWEEVEGEAGLHREEMRQDPGEAAEAIKNLVDLGYIEPPSEDAEQAIAKCQLDQSNNLLRALINSQRSEAAIPLLQRLTSSHPEQHYYRYQLASVLYDANRLGECEEAIALLPPAAHKAVDVQFLISRLLHRRGDLQGTMRIIDSILQASLLNIATINQVGSFLIELEQWNPARALFEKSIESYSKNPIAFGGLAQACNEDEEFEEAADYALKAIAIQPFFPEAHFALGVALRGLDRDQEAITAFEACLSMGHEPEPAHVHLASLCRIRDPTKSRRHALLAGVRLN